MSIRGQARPLLAFAGLCVAVCEVGSRLCVEFSVSEREPGRRSDGRTEIFTIDSPRNQAYRASV